MSLEYFAILTLVSVLSVVQSFFGMGVLVFGTPTLLLIGYDFPTTLSFLLPASFSISLLQVLPAGSGRVPVSGYLYGLCLPGIGIGLLLTDGGPLAPWVNLLVGMTLLLSSLVRCWAPLNSGLTFLLNRHFPLFHLAMGLLHGLTNLGGAMLAILASGLHSDKAAVRYTVAHYYLAFSFVQMALLASVLGHSGMLMENLPLAAVSALVYLLVGNRIFIRSSNQSFNRGLTFFLAAYGIAVLVRL